MPGDKGLRKAIATAGGTRALARKLGVSPAAVSSWRRLPYRHLDRAVEVLGLTREELGQPAAIFIVHRQEDADQVAALLALLARSRRE